MKEENDENPSGIRNVEDSINTELMKHFTGEHTGFIQVGEKKWCFPSKTKDDLEDLYNFQVRSTDVWIVTFPRSGTTLTQEMVWLLMNNLNYEEASKTSLHQRFPFMEYNSIIDPKQKELFLKENAHSEANCKAIENLTGEILPHLSKMTGRRFIKTHLPLSLLPKNLLTSGCKVVYVARNPKNVAISFYHHNRLLRTRGYVGDFSTFWKYFTQNLVIYTPYWDHVLEAWNKRNEKNIIFLFYENIIKDMKESISQLQKFLGKSYTDEELSTLETHLHIDNFRKNESVNFNILYELGIFTKGEEGFVRQGKSGNAEDYFSEEEHAAADKWIEVNLKGTDLKFPNK